MAQPSFDSILNAVMQAESGGRRYDERGNLLTSPKGAKGEMQVLDTTKFRPGFGVEPARANTPDERARVGRDYLKAMLERYGDVDKALAAYNWGPGNTDKWIAKGADPSKLPAETRGYIDQIKSALSGSRPTAQAPAQAPEAAPVPAAAAGAPRAAPVRVSEVEPAARTADLGASYQAALALSYLADEDERGSGGREYDERQPSISSQWLARETARVKPEMLTLPYRSPFEEEKPVAMADGGFIAVGYNDVPGYEEGGEVEAVGSRTTDQNSFGEYRVPPGQTEARLREFNRLDPGTQWMISKDDPRVQFALTPAPASVSEPYTLSTMPGARALYDQTLTPERRIGGYANPALRLRDRSSGKEIPTQDVVFLQPGRPKATEVQTRAHEAEHLLAKRGLGDATAINDKFDELIGDSKARRRFVEEAVKMQPYLQKAYGTESSYFRPEMLAYQDRKGKGPNLLYEQFAELAAIEQATGKDLTKDPELRKTIFKDQKVREVYNAMTGLRQTRLDARDLSPYTPIPEKPEGMMGFIRSKLGFASGGDVSADSEEDILARAQAAAREGQAYRDMQEYLKARDAMPEIKAGSLPSQTAAEFQRTILPVGAGTIKINRGRLTDRTRETLPATLTHELAHAVDRQISQQAAEQAGMPNQFTEAYRKLMGPDESRRADIARKLDPAWEKRNRSYRSSPRELAGHGMGAFVDNAAQTPGPGHVDATAATELAILMDLANRNVDKKPKGLEKISAFLRGIGYADGGEAKKEATARGMLESLRSGEGAQSFLRGLTMLPQNIVGAPVDLATLAMRPFGYNVEKPVMGSEWLKEKSRAAGVAFPEPQDPNARALYTAGDIASNLISPVGATRAAVRGVKEVGQQAGQAAKMLREMKPPSGPDLAPAGVPAEAVRKAPEKSLEELVSAPMMAEGSHRDFLRLEKAAREQVKAGEPVTAIPKERLMQFTKPAMELEGGLKWYRLTDPRAAILEGGAMNHSIGQYAQDRGYDIGGLPAFLAGRAEVYSLRGESGRPLVTMSVEKYNNGERYVRDIRGPSNSDPSKYRQEIFAFMADPKNRVIDAEPLVYSQTPTEKKIEPYTIFWKQDLEDWKLGILDYRRKLAED